MSLPSFSDFTGNIYNNLFLYNFFCTHVNSEIFFTDIPVSAVTTNSFSQPLNSPITLSCDTLANPSAISWQWKYNGFILDGQTEKLYTVDMNSELDYGQYTCIAYNEVGHSVDIHFSVTGGECTYISITSAQFFQWRFSTSINWLLLKYALQFF